MTPKPSLRSLAQISIGMQKEPSLRIDLPTYSPSREGPSLSSDVKSMLHDELWQEVKQVQDACMKNSDERFGIMCKWLERHRDTLIEHSKRLQLLETLCRGQEGSLAQLEERVATIESTLAQWQATVWAKQIEERVATLEQVTAGPPEGPGFGQLEQRVAALEQIYKNAQFLECIDEIPLGIREPEPLPWGELD